MALWSVPCLQITPAGDFEGGSDRDTKLREKTRKPKRRQVMWMEGGMGLKHC